MSPRLVKRLNKGKGLDLLYEIAFITEGTTKLHSSVKAHYKTENLIKT